MTPAISVCLPTHNGAAHIEAALASVLAQTYTDIEVVVSDDASVDDTLERVGRWDDPRLRILPPTTRGGAAANWNRVVAHARGRYLKVMGQDDLLDPQCLARQAAVLDADPEVAFVAVRRRLIDDRDRPLLRPRAAGPTGRIGRATALDWIVRSGRNPVGEPAAVLARTDAVHTAGGFDDALGYVIDLECWCRLLMHGDLHLLDEVLCSFRVSPRAWSGRLARVQARQTRGLFRELRASHPRAVSALAYATGSAKAEVWRLARSLLYARLRLAAMPTHNSAKMKK